MGPSTSVVGMLLLLLLASATDRMHRLLPLLGGTWKASHEAAHVMAKAAAAEGRFDRIFNPPSCHGSHQPQLTTVLFVCAVLCGQAGNSKAWSLEAARELRQRQNSAMGRLPFWGPRGKKIFLRV